MAFIGQTADRYGRQRCLAAEAIKILILASLTSPAARAAAAIGDLDVAGPPPEGVGVQDSAQPSWLPKETILQVPGRGIRQSRKAFLAVGVALAIGLQLLLLARKKFGEVGFSSALHFHALRACGTCRASVVRKKWCGENTTTATCSLLSAAMTGPRYTGARSAAFSRARTAGEANRDGFTARRGVLWGIATSGKAHGFRCLLTPTYVGRRRWTSEESVNVSSE